MASPRERDYRQPQPASSYRQPLRLPPAEPRRLPPAEPPRVRHHHFHDVPPWPQQRYHDYAYVEGGGWWPRWYPYWDQGWYDYWWTLYDYYGGDENPDYAEYARDAIFRQYGPQWGLVISGYGSGAQVGYGGTQVGIQPYGVAAVAQRYSPYGYGQSEQIAAYRALALEQARRIQAAVSRVLVGYRDSPWGSELTIFGTRAGLQRWANEQGQDPDVWYAAAFDLGQSLSPLSEVAR